MEDKIEGYWYSKYSNQYPMPIPNILTDIQANEIYNLILEKQNESFVIRYRGRSRSRITEQILGCVEYVHSSGWIWPGDFAEHYVLNHKVKPTDEFLNFLNYKI